MHLPGECSIVREDMSRKRVFKYSVSLIAKVLGKSPWTVRRAVNSGRIELGNLVSVAMYIVERRNHAIQAKRQRSILQARRKMAHQAAMRKRRKSQGSHPAPALEDGSLG